MKIKLKDIYIQLFLFIIVAIGLYPITIYLIFNYIINSDFNDNKR